MLVMYGTEAKACRKSEIERRGKRKSEEENPLEFRRKENKTISKEN